MPERKPPAPDAPGEDSPERRRSHRVQIAIPILVRGKSGDQAFEEETQTVSVSAHGCKMRIRMEVWRGQEVAIVNPATAEDIACIVTFVGLKEAGKMEIGVEFVEPSPRFWRISFPPEDWDPTERKREGSAHHPRSRLRLRR